MPFTFEAKDAHLRGPMLVATVKDASNNWVESRLQLNDYIGNNDARFDLTLTGWFHKSKPWSARLDGSILSAELQGNTPYGFYGYRTSLDLNLFVRNVKGQLVFKRPHQSILLSACCFEFDAATLKLQGLCLGTDGKFQLAGIQLNDYYANDSGSFASNRSNNLANIGHNFRIELSKTSLKLLAELPDDNHVFRPAEIDLSIDIVNRNGKFLFEEHSGFLDRDGWLAEFLEPLPILGLVVAIVHKLAGNDEQAARALALSTNSSTGLLLGAAIGTLFANPVLGAIVGAAITSPTGIFAEAEISSRLIDDPRLRAQFEEATAGRYVYETLRNMVTAGPATNFALRVSKKVNPQIDRFLKGVKAEMAKKGLDLAVSDRVQNILNGVVDLLAGGVKTEWEDALNKGHEIIKAGVRSKREADQQKLEDAEAKNRQLEQKLKELSTQSCPIHAPQVVEKEKIVEVPRLPTANEAATLYGAVTFPTLSVTQNCHHWDGGYKVNRYDVWVKVIMDLYNHDQRIGGPSLSFEPNREPYVLMLESDMGGKNAIEQASTLAHWAKAHGLS